MTGLPFVMSAPSGTGKTTLCRALVERDENLRFSTSHTTRDRRSGEMNGVDYYFVEEREFMQLEKQGAFLEWASYGAHLYGTSRDSILTPISSGFDLLLEIEVIGAGLIRKSDVEAKFIFLLPPNMGVLESLAERFGSGLRTVFLKAR